MLGPDEHRFVGVLYELPSNYSHIMNVALDVPATISQAFGMRGHVPVVGTADGVDLTATLVPVGGGRHRLFLNGAVRGAIGKEAGDPIEIRIRLDRLDRTPETPPELQGALAEGGATAARVCRGRWAEGSTQGALAEGGATAAWEALAPSRRKELLVWLADAKRDQTRAARIGRIVQTALTEGTPRLV